MKGASDIGAKIRFGNLVIGTRRYPRSRGGAGRKPSAAIVRYSDREDLAGFGVICVPGQAAQFRSAKHPTRTMLRGGNIPCGARRARRGFPSLNRHSRRQQGNP
jgi:hypothetical protein